jgi:superfamily I DNA and/or RNA helicase
METPLHIQELENVKKALILEKEAEIKMYQDVFLKQTLDQRVKDGVTWAPVTTETTGYGLGAYPYIVVERQKMRDKPHRLRAGQIVVVFSIDGRNNKEANSEAKGIVVFVDKNKMKISFYSDEMPEWAEYGKLGVDMAFDERSYKEMELALDKVMAAKNDRLAELRDILLAAKKPEPPNAERFHYQLPNLNDSQNDAIQRILDTPDVMLVHGPPGTGKTTTITYSILQLLKSEKQILVCAPSNAAVDLLTQKLAEQAVNVLRLGNLSRIDEDLFEHTLDGMLAKQPEMAEVKKLKIEAASLFKKHNGWKRSFSATDREAKREGLKEAKMLVQHARMLEGYTIEKMIDNAQVICTTLVGAVDGYIAKRKYKTVIIDEAAQALEPATWIPILRAERIILAGDPFQLPPTVKNIAAEKAGLSKTLMEKILTRLPLNSSLLNVQYRMNQKIMQFSNQQFYNNQLQAHESVAHRQLQFADGELTEPLTYIDTAGCGFDEKINPETESRYNEEEYFVIRQHLDDLLTRCADKNPSIAIISPYKEQVNFMQQAFKTDFDHFPNAKVEINTIDSFQGQECDIVYISMVRSNEKAEIGFLSDIRRMNVAMTRAKLKLIVVGDSATLCSNKFYNDFFDFVDSINAHDTAWAYWTI